MLLCASRTGFKLMHKDGTVASTNAIRPHRGSTSECSFLAHEASAVRVLSGGSDGQLCVSDANAVLYKRSVVATAKCAVQCVAVHWGAGYVAAGDAAGGLSLLAADETLSGDVQSFTDSSSAATRLAFAPNGLALACARADGRVTVQPLVGETDEMWQWAAARAQAAAATRVAYSASGEWLAAAFGDGRVLSSAAERGDAVAEPLDGRHEGKVSGLCFSPTSNVLLASCGADRCVRFFDVEQRSVVREMVGMSRLTALAFHGDGVTLAAGTSTGSVLLYDLRGSTDKPFARVIAHSPFAVTSLEFYAAPIESREALDAMLAARAPPFQETPRTSTAAALRRVKTTAQVKKTAAVTAAQAVAAAAALVAPPLSAPAATAREPKKTPLSHSTPYTADGGAPLLPASSPKPPRSVRINIAENQTYEAASYSLLESSEATPAAPESLATPIGRLQFQSGTEAEMRLRRRRRLSELSATPHSSAKRSTPPLAAETRAADPTTTTTSNNDELYEALQEYIDASQHRTRQQLCDMHMSLVEEFHEAQQTNRATVDTLMRANADLSAELRRLRLMLGQVLEHVQPRGGN